MSHELLSLRAERGETCGPRAAHCIYWAHMLQLLKLMCLEPVLHNKKSPHNEKPKYHKED